MGVDILGESQNRVLKLVFVVQEPNAGGGQISFDRNETAELGIDHATLSRLDSAKLTNTVSRLSHEVSPLESGCYICGLEVMTADSSY